MTKQEFLEALGRKLAEGLPQGEVYRQMQYYEGYIDAEMRRGRTEEEVISELGDPLLLARNVLGSPVSATAVWNEVSPYEQGFAEGSYESRFAPKEEEKVPVYGSSGFQKVTGQDVKEKVSERKEAFAARREEGRADAGASRARNAGGLKNGGGETFAGNEGTPDGRWRKEPDPEELRGRGTWKKMPDPDERKVMDPSAPENMETLQGKVVRKPTPGFFGHLVPLIFAVIIVVAFVIAVATGAVAVGSLLWPVILLVAALVIVFVLTIRNKRK